MDERLAGQAGALRAEGMAPKAIARTLGMRVTDVVAALNGAAPTGVVGEPQC